MKKKRLNAINFLSRFLFLMITPVFFQYFALGFIWHSIYWGAITMVVMIWALFIILTPLFGRVGCGWFCFMGTTYDCAHSVRPHTAKYRKTMVWLRVLTTLTFFTTAFVFHFLNIRRGITDGFHFQPFFLEPDFTGHYRLVWTIDVSIAAVTALVTNKRWGCRNICILGSLSSLLARYSRLVPVVDTQKCVSCGRCEQDCLTGVHLLQYIKENKGLVTDTECVMCGSCSNACQPDAIKYQFVWNRKKYLARK